MSKLMLKTLLIVLSVNYAGVIKAISEMPSYFETQSAFEELNSSLEVSPCNISDAPTQVTKTDSIAKHSSR